MGRRAGYVIGGIVAAAAIAFIVERLIVTEKEAILLAADHCAQAIGRGDIGEAVKVLHPAAMTGSGNAEQTRIALEAQLRQFPLDHVNFLLQELTVEKGVGRMRIEVFAFPKDKNLIGNLAHFKMTVEWEKDGDGAWKVRRADVR